MSHIIRSVSLIACLVLALLIVPGKAFAAEGVDVKVIAEWPVDIPGVEKMQLRRVEFQPGATLSDFEVKFVDFCNATQGTWVLEDLSTGETNLRTAGSRWRMPPKGTKVNISNPGSEPAVQFVYRLIEEDM